MKVHKIQYIVFWGHFSTKYGGSSLFGKVCKLLFTLHSRQWPPGTP